MYLASVFQKLRHDITEVKYKYESESEYEYEYESKYEYSACTGCQGNEATHDTLIKREAIRDDTQIRQEGVDGVEGGREGGSGSGRWFWQ